jgi:hypothetical protein
MLISRVTAAAALLLGTSAQAETQTEAVVAEARTYLYGALRERHLRPLRTR